jgi:hypothetical protein
MKRYSGTRTSAASMFSNRLSRNNKSSKPFPHTEYPPLKTPHDLGELLEIRDVPGKGRGVFLKDSQSQVPAGSILYKESHYDAPFVLLSLPRDKDEQALERLLKEQWDQLSEDRRRKFAQCYWGDGLENAENTLASRFQQCNYAFGTKSQPQASVYWGMSFPNHSCRPNAMMDWDEEGNVTLFSILPIRGSDTEICVNYLNYTSLLTKYATRQAKLRKQWRFRCRCEVCMQHTNQYDPEDTKRSRAQRLAISLRVYDLENMNNYDLHTAEGQLKAEMDIEELIMLLEEVRVVDLLGNAYVQATVIYSSSRNDKMRAPKMQEFYWRFKAYVARYQNLDQRGLIFSDGCNGFLNKKVRNVNDINILCEEYRCTRNPPIRLDPNWELESLPERSGRTKRRKLKIELILSGARKSVKRAAIAPEPSQSPGKKAKLQPMDEPRLRRSPRTPQLSRRFDDL